MEYTPFPVPQSVRASLIINSIIALAAVLVVTLRCVARLVAGARLGWDDHLMLAALPQGIGLLVCLGLWAPTGLGDPSPAVLPNFPYIFTILLPFQVLFVSCVLTVKLSALVFYYRVFTSAAMRRATKLTIALVAAWGLGNVLQTFMVCHISDGKWVLLNGGCSDLAPSNIATGIFNCTTNLGIALLPIYTIWSLPRVSISTRLHLSAVFLLSTIVTIVSIVRLWYLLFHTKPPGGIEHMPTILLLTVVEANLSMVTNSSPMLLPLYTWWRYRRVWGEGADDYVSRLRGAGAQAHGGGGGGDDDCEGARGGRRQRRGGAAGSGGRLRSAVEDLVNGVPLETIYGVDHVHFTATVARGSMNADSIKMTREAAGHKTRRLKKKRRRPPPPSEMTDSDDSEEDEHDASESESTRRLPRSAQMAGRTGIQIETKWSITEETVK